MILKNQRQVINIRPAVKEHLDQIQKSLNLPSATATIAYLISLYRMMQNDIEHFRHEILKENAIRMSRPGIKKIRYKTTEISLITGQIDDVIF